MVLAHNCLRLNSLSIFDQRSNYHIYSSGLSDIITLDFQLKYILMKLKPCIINLGLSKLCGQLSLVQANTALPLKDSYLDSPI